ncbi:glycoside hydrolase family 43 protein [Microdochium trichocladiopsis]|uniref:Arabinan endo-1,5-alpha-L-arabinosidase n=1 Tax=Microdochium trichocladiopsis TaxID=1682393 RepID=A0A9P8XTU0_9PEZI|nr:glycoside hydrolase family 43 protein [Microdochium trichocladiopsis]KAH7016444.1 glycoside hydrolase family 43 protein [Microdochium trichocladiopsis]
MLLSTVLATFLASVPALVQAYPQPGACTGYCFTHDPALYRRPDGKYFRFSTFRGIEIVTANNIAGPWTKVGSVLPNGSIINMPGNKELWAPDVAYIQGQYYLFYPVSTSGSQTSAIGYATSPNMEPGSWTDQGSILTSAPGQTPYNAIDANLVPHANGRDFYLQWGSYWDQIYQAQLSINGPYVFASGNHKRIAHDPRRSSMEGPTIFYKKGYYWLFLSLGACCTYTPKPADEYHVNLCRSTSPSGPFVDKAGKSCQDGGGTNFIHTHDRVYAAGGQGVFTDPTLGDVFYYHYLDPDAVDYNSAKFGWNVINWSADWPTI